MNCSSRQCFPLSSVLAVRAAAVGDLKVQRVQTLGAFAAFCAATILTSQNTGTKSWSDWFQLRKNLMALRHVVGPQTRFLR